MLSSRVWSGLLRLCNRRRRRALFHNKIIRQHAAPLIILVDEKAVYMAAGVYIPKAHEQLPICCDQREMRCKRSIPRGSIHMSRSPGFKLGHGVVPPVDGTLAYAQYREKVATAPENPPRCIRAIPYTPPPILNGDNLPCTGKTSRM